MGLVRSKCVWGRLAHAIGNQSDSRSFSCFLHFAGGRSYQKNHDDCSRCSCCIWRIGVCEQFIVDRYGVNRADLIDSQHDINEIWYEAYKTHILPVSMKASLQALLNGKTFLSTTPNPGTTHASSRTTARSPGVLLCGSRPRNRSKRQILQRSTT